MLPVLISSDIIPYFEKTSFISSNVVSKGNPDI